MSSSQRLGKYEIQGLLGKGTRATVYRAVDMESKRSVAIKVIPRELVDARAVAPFKKYAVGLAQVAHPGIAPFIEMLETAQTVCTVGALAEGVPLSTLLKDGAYPEPRIARGDVRRCGGASGAHQRGRSIATHARKILLAADGRVSGDVAPRCCRRDGEAIHFRSPSTSATASSHRSDLTRRAPRYRVNGKLPFPKREEMSSAFEGAPEPASHTTARLAAEGDQKAMAKNPDERFTARSSSATAALGCRTSDARSTRPAAPDIPAAVRRPSPRGGRESEPKPSTTGPRSPSPLCACACCAPIFAEREAHRPRRRAAESRAPRCAALLRARGRSASTAPAARRRLQATVSSSTRTALLNAWWRSSARKHGIPPRREAALAIRSTCRTW